MKMSLKGMLYGLSLSAACVLPFYGARAGGIPVIDSVHISETVAQYLQMVEQLTLMQNWWNEARGITNIGHTVSTQLDATRSSLFASTAPSVSFATPTFAPSVLFPNDSKSKTDYINRGNFIYGNIEKINSMYAKLAERQENLVALRDEIGSATTNKQILDLNARINAENGLLQNDIAMISVLKISMDLSGQALEHDEAGRMISNLKDASDVH